MCDQLRAFEVGCYGNEVIRTPNIDRLAEEGVRFEHAVTNNPVCMPARSSLLTGQYSRTCMGYLGNYAEIGPDGRRSLPEYPAQERTMLLDPTLPEQLKRLGYDTALFGKWHVHPAPHLAGFDYSLFPRVHHRHTGQTFVENVGTGEVVDEFSVDFEAERVREYLAADRDRPFFMFYSISPPHMPLMDAPEQYLTMYSSDEVPLRPNVFVDGRMAYDEHWFKIYLWDFLFYQEDLPHTRTLPEGFDLRRLVALYYGMTTWVDDTVGRLMRALEVNGLSEDTIVVFLSDHGDNLGSHHLFNKSTLIQEAIRIPMIFHAPGRWAARINRAQVAQIIDVMPTLLGLCGGDVPESVQGHSLVPLIEGTCEELEENVAFIETSRGEIGVRTTTHLYGAQLADDLREAADECRCFFDLVADPYEQGNLAGGDREPALADELRGRLLEWHRLTWIRNTDGQDVS